MYSWRRRWWKWRLKRLATALSGDWRDSPKDDADLCQRAAGSHVWQAHHLIERTLCDS